MLQQEAYASGWCAERGYLLTRVFRDVAHSGSTVVGRDAFQEMVAYLREGSGGELGVIIWRFNRFSRDIDDAQYFKADLRRRGFEIISLQDNVPQGPEGRLIESIIDWSSQQYLEDLKRDIRRGQRYLAVVHKVWPLGKIPLGYQRQPINIGTRRNGQPHIGWKLVPDPKTAPLVRMAFELRASGLTYKEINAQVHLLNSKSSYSGMFESSIYIGTFRLADTIVDDFCEPIVDLATWQAVQEIRHSWSVRWGFYQPRAATSEFLLTGLLRCSLCGSPMYGRQARGPGNRGPYFYYGCKYNQGFQKCLAPYLPKDQIEGMVINSLAGWAQKPAMLWAVYNQIVDQSRSGSAELDAQASGLAARLGDVDSAINRLVAAIKAAGHSQALLVELGKLEQEQTELRQAVAQLEAKRARPVLALSFSQLTAVGEGIASRLLSRDYREQQRVLRSFVKEIRAKRLGSRDAEIDGNIVFFPPAPIGGSSEIVVPLVRGDPEK